jgi:GeoRSP system SPASM domain protein
MNLQELSSPLRIYWDIGPAPGVDVDACRRIAGEIVENKFLSLQVTETAPALSDAGRAIIDALQGAPLAFSFVASPAVLNDDAAAVFRRSAVKVLYLASRSSEDWPGIADRASRLSGKPAWGVSFGVSRGNWRQLPDLLSWCVRQGVGYLLLPMQRLTAGEECFFLSAAEQRDMAKRLQAIPRPSSLTITIHDPFLWKTFFPDREFPGGGCQAANTMLYISPGADVYPCPRIGSLLQAPLRDVIRSEEKKEARRRLLQVPVQCGACGDLAACKGGCRGRVYALSGTMDRHDPSCT